MSDPTNCDWCQRALDRGYRWESNGCYCYGYSRMGVQGIEGQGAALFEMMHELIARWPRDDSSLGTAFQG